MLSFAFTWCSPWCRVQLIMVGNSCGSQRSQTTNTTNESKRPRFNHVMRAERIASPQCEVSNLVGLRVVDLPVYLGLF